MPSFLILKASPRGRLCRVIFFFPRLEALPFQVRWLGSQSIPNRVLLDDQDPGFYLASINRLPLPADTVSCTVPVFFIQE